MNEAPNKTTFELSADAGPKGTTQDYSALKDDLAKRLGITISPDHESGPSHEAGTWRALTGGWESILLTLAASGGVVTTLIGVLQTWVGQKKDRSVTIKAGGDEFIISGQSAEEVERILKILMDRYAPNRNE